MRPRPRNNDRKFLPKPRSEVESNAARLVRLMTPLTRFSLAGRPEKRIGTFKDYMTNPGAISDNGQVASVLSADRSVAKAILWQNGKITDLGRIGGRYAYVSGINNSGEIAGFAKVETRPCPPASPGPGRSAP